MNSSTPAIYLGHKSSVQVADRIRAAAPDCRILAPEDIGRDPSLKRGVEIMIHGSDFDVAEWPSLRWVQKWSAGVSEALIQMLAPAPVTITTVSGIHAEPIAEHAFAMMLMFARRMPWVMAHRGWEGRKLAPGADVLAGHTLGIAGLGAIGLRAAQLAGAFGMCVAAIRRHPQSAPGVEWVGSMDDLSRLLGESDYVLNLLPLTKETRGAFGRAQFAAMKPAAIYTSFGRGATTDTEALVEALRSGTIRGAGLDVVDPEPLPAGHPLWTMDNVVLTPHCSGLHERYNENALAIFLENLRRYRAGLPLNNVVDKSLGY